MNLNRRVIFYVLIFNLFLFIVNLIFAQAVFLKNVRLALVTEEIATLEQKNKELKVQVAKSESVDLIINKAKKQGFLQNPAVLYISVSKLARND